MPKTSTVNDMVKQVFIGAHTERQKAVALHNYVRDYVKYGFSPYFDAALPDYTLAYGYGHCNPKTRLLVDAFRAAGLASHQHFVVLSKEILRGAIPASMYRLIPPELSHSYAEVRVGGVWYNIDSYVVDTPLLEAGQARLAKEGRQLGYGVRSGGTNKWDGHSDAFSEFSPKLMLEDHGRIEDLDGYFHSSTYRHYVLGIRFNTLFRLMGRLGAGAINHQIDNVRQDYYAMLTQPAASS